MINRLKLAAERQRGTTRQRIRTEEKPWVVGRKPFGRITIANSDAGANAYTNEAIDQAYRAVKELSRS